MDDAFPEVHYARSDDVHIAYQVLGEGDVDLVFVMGWLTNLETYWELPGYRRFMQRLAGFTRLILFDKRGMGLSDHTAIGTLEERMDDVRAVMDAVGSERAVLLGVSEGAPLSMVFAATHPERTAGLIFVGGEVKEILEDDWPLGQETREEYEGHLEKILSGEMAWGQPKRVWFAPSKEYDPAVMAWVGRLERTAASPAAAVAFMRLGSELDVRHVAPSIHVPTLVMHVPGDLSSRSHRAAGWPSRSREHASSSSRAGPRALVRRGRSGCRRDPRVSDWLSRSSRTRADPGDRALHGHRRLD